MGSATLLPPSRRGSSYAVTGGTLSVAAGRLSFVLGLHGPCMSIDTACSAFHVAVHTGAQALRAVGRGDIAEAGLAALEGRPA